MLRRDIEGVMRGVLPTTSRTSITLTGVPAERGAKVVRDAVAYCRGNAAPLSEIHLPAHLQSDLAEEYQELILADSGADDVFRFVFQP